MARSAADTAAAGIPGGSGGHPSGTATCEDEIDTTYNWVSSGPGDDPPESVIVMEQCTATAGGSDYGSDAPQVSALNGLHDTPQSTTTPIMSGPYRIGTQASTTSQGAHYRVVAGQASLPLQCTPKASSTVVNGPCSASVTYSPSISPVTIQITGTKDPVNGDFRVLTGQQIKATLQCIPGGFTVTNYTWSVGGDAFKDYDTTAPNSTNATQLVPLGPSDLTGPAQGQTTVADLYFYDKKAESLTVSCDVTMTAPDGTSLSVTAKSPQISVKKPTVDWSIGGGVGGLMPGFYSDQSRMTATETWGPIFITEPAPFGSNGSQNSVGTGVLVQIASPNMDVKGLNEISEVTYDKIQVLYPDGTTGVEASPTGLDGSFPYGFGFYLDTTGTWREVMPGGGGYAWIADEIGYSADTPTRSFTGPDPTVSWIAADATESFDTWVMYRPPSMAEMGTVYVPLQRLTWSWGGSARLDLFSDNWSVSQTQPFVPGSPTDTNTPPSWNLTIPLNPVMSQ